MTKEEQNALVHDLIDALERVREAVDKGETLIRVYCIADNALFRAKFQMRSRS